MYLDDFSQEYLVNSLDELEVLLRKRFLEEVNFFILTFKENGFPQLSAFVKENKCVMRIYTGQRCSLARIKC